MYQSGSSRTAHRAAAIALAGMPSTIELGEELGRNVAARLHPDVTLHADDDRARRPGEPWPDRRQPLAVRLHPRLVVSPLSVGAG